MTSDPGFTMEDDGEDEVEGEVPPVLDDSVLELQRTINDVNTAGDEAAQREAAKAWAAKLAGEA